jgi:hypothetical protein
VYQNFLLFLIFVKIKCFGRHTVHHQEPKMHWQPLIFYTWKVVGRVVGGRCQAHCAWQRPPITRPNKLSCMKNQRLPVHFRLLMMGCVSPETFWASYKEGILKVWYIVASCWIFPYECRKVSVFVARIIRNTSLNTLDNMRSFRNLPWWYTY